MAISKTSGRNSKKQTEASHTVLEAAPKAALLMLLSGLFILLLSTLITINLPSPATFARPASLASLLIGSAVGGYFCSKRTEVPSAYACGGMSVLALIIVLIIAKALIPAPASSSGIAFSVIGYILSAASAMLGVFVGTKTHKRKKRKKHYRS